MAYLGELPRKGMNYGAMPMAALLDKLEPGIDRNDGNAGGYHEYAVGELLDRAPETTYLESDHPRRDPALSRSIINLRYNGTRGSDPNLPRHPEMFYGFLDPEPRGIDGQPRLDQIRRQGQSRLRNLEVRMGYNEGHGGGADGAALQDAERPWTGPAFERARAELHQRAKQNLKLFTLEKDGRAAAAGNAAPNPSYGVLQREAQQGCGEEGIVGLNSRRGRAETTTRRDGPSLSDCTSAVWRNALAGAQLTAARYSRQPTSGEIFGDQRRASGVQQQRLGGHARARASRAELAAHMADAARRRRARGRRLAPDGAWATEMPGAQGRKDRLGLGRDIAFIYREQQKENTFYLQNTNEPAGGLVPPADPRVASSMADAATARALQAVAAVRAARMRGDDQRLALNQCEAWLRPALSLANAPPAGAAPAGDPTRHLQVLKTEMASLGIEMFNVKQARKGCEGGAMLRLRQWAGLADGRVGLDPGGQVSARAAQRLGGGRTGVSRCARFAEEDMTAGRAAPLPAYTGQTRIAGKVQQEAGAGLEGRPASNPGSFVGKMLRSDMFS